MATSSRRSRASTRPPRSRRVGTPVLLALGSLVAVSALFLRGPPQAFAPRPPAAHRRPADVPGAAQVGGGAASHGTPLKAARDGGAVVAARVPETEDVLGNPLAVGLAGVLGGVALAEAGFAPPQAVVDKTTGTVLGSLLEHHGSFGEDIFLASVFCVTAYCLLEMGAMQMRCPHWEARVHVASNFLAAIMSLYGVAMERFFRESPDLWWAVLTPVLYGVSNLTMRQLMSSYKGPQAYTRLFELGQSFTLSFQGIHLLAWSSVYPALYWVAMPFWYWSLKKLVEQLVYMLGLVSDDNSSGPEQAHMSRSETWGGFGLGLDALTITFALVNFAATLADNAYMGVYTMRGPDGFFEASRSLAETGGWGSDHLRMALVKPALGSLVLSMAVFLGTLVSRRRLPLAVGVPISAVLSALGPWLVFFWHRLVDPAEPWLPELLGEHWGPFVGLGQ